MAEQATAGRREQILEAALRVIGRSGRQAVTHRSVAEEAGVPLRSPTHFFHSRGDLLRPAPRHLGRGEVWVRRAGGSAGAGRGAGGGEGGGGVGGGGGGAAQGEDAPGAGGRARRGARLRG